MTYQTIFKTKPKKENKKEFCQRIVKLLDEIEFCIDNYIYKDGERMLNTMFKYSELNDGYESIDDLLNETEKSYKSIFALSKLSNENIKDEEILANIDILTNSLNSFKRTSDRYFYHANKAKEIVSIIMKAVNQYLLSNSYRLEFDKNQNQIFIVDNEISIDTNEIKDEKLKSEIINFYNYKNANDIDEKKKIMLILIGNLENRKNNIEEILGAKIADMFSNYANNFNLRHNNIDKNYKKYYNRSIDELSDEEILKWYDYIFAFMINIYLSLDKLKLVNINEGYK